MFLSPGARAGKRTVAEQILGISGGASIAYTKKRLFINLNSAPTSPPGDALISLTAADAQNARISIETTGAGSSAFSFRHAGGTLLNKTTLTNNTVIGIFGGAGWLNGAYTNNVARITFVTNEDWSATGFQGTRVNIDVTINGTTTLANRFSLTDTRLTLSTTEAATSKTTGSLVLSGGLGISGDAYADSFFTNVATFFARSKITLNNGAAAQTGTLTNAPAAGNPTKWLPFDDNGTTRYVPAW